MEKTLRQIILETRDNAEKYIADGTEYEEYEKGVRDGATIIQHDYVAHVLNKLKMAIQNAEEESKEIGDVLYTDKVMKLSAEEYDELEIRDVSNNGYISGLSYALKLLEGENNE